MFRKNPQYGTGLDISDRSIEIVQLESKGKKIKLSGVVRVDLPAGVVVKGEIKDTLKFDKAFNDLLDKAEKAQFTFDNLSLTIPEEYITIHLVKGEKDKKINDVEKYVIAKLKGELSKKSSAWQFDIYEIQTRDSMKYLFIGIESDRLYDYVKVAAEFGLRIELAEPESSSILKHIVPEETGDVILDFGYEKSTIFFAVNSLLYRREFFNWGSNNLIKGLAELSKLSPEKEEKFFKKIGYNAKLKPKQKKVFEEEFEKLNKKILLQKLH